MYGGKWVQTRDNWQLVWSAEAICDFYLNNVLIHELAHLLDHRNRSYRDRERYAEWFAIEYGYKPSRRAAV
jgi:predicted SprT family Zn-dependent metalloprotease